MLELRSCSRSFHWNDQRRAIGTECALLREHVLVRSRRRYGRGRPGGEPRHRSPGCRSWIDHRVRDHLRVPLRTSRNCSPTRPRRSPIRTKTKLPLQITFGYVHPRGRGSAPTVLVVEARGQQHGSNLRELRAQRDRGRPGRGETFRCASTEAVPVALRGGRSGREAEVVCRGLRARVRGRNQSRRSVSRHLPARPKAAEAREAMRAQWKKAERRSTEARRRRRRQGRR